jgi:hypothetical protein
MTTKIHKNQKKHSIIDDIEHKHCYCCDKWRPLSSFNKSKTVWDGLDRQCRNCQKAYREKNKARLLAQKKEYRNKNKEKLRQYKIDNKERFDAYNKEYQARYRKENKEVLQQYFKERYQEKKDSIRKAQCLYNQIPSVRKANTLRHKKWLQKESNRLVHNQRTRICKLLRGERKYNSSKDLIGCTIDFLKEYLSNKFTDGMFWDNYGEWHVDHIRPCNSFDLTDLKEQQKCFHYTNLQPLWGSENCSKGCEWNPSKLVFIESPIYYH